MAIEYTLKQLEVLPTLSVGQSCDLKIETEITRVWLSRCSVAHGEPYNKVTVETWDLDNGGWIEERTYQAR